MTATAVPADIPKQRQHIFDCPEAESSITTATTSRIEGQNDRRINGVIKICPLHRLIASARCRCHTVLPYRLPSSDSESSGYCEASPAHDRTPCPTALRFSICAASIFFWTCLVNQNKNGSSTSSTSVRPRFRNQITARMLMILHASANMLTMPDVNRFSTVSTSPTNRETSVPGSCTVHIV